MDAILEKKQTAFRLSSDLLEKLKAEAKKQNRSLNNFVECVLMDWVYSKPNSETASAIKETKSGKYAGTLSMNSFDSFMNSLNDIE